MKSPPFALAIHGGAGAHADVQYKPQEDHIRATLEDGRNRLAAGMSALDVVMQAVKSLEASGLYVAGKGASPNLVGFVELDASIMEGHSLRSGAVAAIRNVQSPVEVARAVMETTPHVMLAGRGAEAFALEANLAQIKDPGAYYSQSAQDLEAAEKRGHESPPHGTVGAVALDIHGHLAAATSTGGTFGKRYGRVGDTPLIGAGSWADEQTAISSTGHGEYFVRLCAAHDIAARIKYGRENLEQAAGAMIRNLGKLGGDGGVICLDKNANIAMPYNSQGMKRGYIRGPEDMFVSTF